MIYIIFIIHIYLVSVVECRYHVSSNQFPYTEHNQNMLDLQEYTQISVKNITEYNVVKIQKL